MISVIIPAYNEEANIRPASERIGAVLSGCGIEYELIFVDDGSADETWKNISLQSEKSSLVRGISFSRNFGKDAAIFAGLSHAQGDCCAVIDCDMQHPPEKLVTMYRLWQDGFELVEGVKSGRGEESAAYSFFAKIFYKLISRSAGIDMVRSSDFKLLDRRAVDALLRMKETGAFFRALSSWVGFKTATVEFQVEARFKGTTKWSKLSLIKYAINNITAFSTAPMQIVTLLGCVMLALAIVLSGITVYQKFAGIALDGFTTVIIIQLFSGSITMVSLGIIGYYIARILNEVKERPKFVISKTCGDKK